MLERVIAITQETGRFLLEDTRNLSVKVFEKAGRDYVTENDLNAEKLILERLEKAFPGGRVLAEESGGEGRLEGALWVVDPLDGTTNFIHGVPVYSVSIALLVDGQAVLGAVYDPSRDETFAAERDKGAWLNGERIRVSTRFGVTDSLIATGFPFRNMKYLEQYQECFRRVFLKVGGMRRMGSACLDQCYVACGRYDGFWELGLRPWDMAGGSLIIKEAGGHVTDFWGGEDFLFGGDIIAGTDGIHQVLLDEIKEVFIKARPSHAGERSQLRR